MKNDAQGAACARPGQDDECKRNYSPHVNAAYSCDSISDIHYYITSMGQRTHRPVLAPEQTAQVVLIQTAASTRLAQRLRGIFALKNIWQRETSTLNFETCGKLRHTGYNGKQMREKLGTVCKSEKFRHFMTMRRCTAAGLPRSHDETREANSVHRAGRTSMAVLHRLNAQAPLLRHPARSLRTRSARLSTPTYSSCAWACVYKDTCTSGLTI